MRKRSLGACGRNGVWNCFACMGLVLWAAAAGHAGEGLHPKPGSEPKTETSVDSKTGQKTIKRSWTVVGTKRKVTTEEVRIYSAQEAFVSGTIFREIQCLAMSRALVQKGVLEERDGKSIEKVRETGQSIGIKVDNTVVSTLETLKGIKVLTTVRTPNPGGTLADLPAIVRKIFNAHGSITVKLWYDPAADPENTPPDEEYTLMPFEELDRDCPSNPKLNSDQIPPRAVPGGGAGTASTFGHPFSSPGTSQPPPAPPPPPLPVSP